MLKYLSLFSGIEAASAAWKPLGWQCVGVAEIEKFPSSVLQYHYPEVPNLGDVTAPDFIDRAKALGPIDILIGGPPCQAFSVAGLRKSLDDDRGNMTLRFAEIINALDPKTIIFENVPGVLSTRDNAFGCFLAALVGGTEPIVPVGRWTHAGMVSGPQRNAAWRILDAQYFGVAQRRKRVFVVACPRGGADPRKILFECEGVSGDTRPRLEENKRAGRLFPSITRRGPGGFREEQAYILRPSGRISNLLPTEVERLQGFPDSYTALPNTADGPRYKALGNSMAVPVIRWLGLRILSELSTLLISPEENGPASARACASQVEAPPAVSSEVNGNGMRGTP